MPAIGCQFAAWRAQLVQLRLLRPVADRQGCDNQATHLATTQHHRPGLLTQMTAHVCVVHAEVIRRGTPGLTTLPHRPLTVAALES